MEKELRSERSCNILFFSLCPLCSLWFIYFSNPKSPCPLCSLWLNYFFYKIFFLFASLYSLRFFKNPSI